MLARLLRTPARLPAAARALSLSSSSSSGGGSGGGGAGGGADLVVKELAKRHSLELDAAAEVARALRANDASSSDADVLRTAEVIGDAGVRAVLDAVSVESAARAAREHLDDAQVVVEVPKERHAFTVTGKVGDSLFSLWQERTEIADFLECACGGEMMCSTCHVYVVEGAEDQEPPEEAEQDMLDLAWGLKDNSRLGCQLRLGKPLKVVIPDESNNYFS